MRVPTLDRIDLAGKRVVIRVDFNVPITDGVVVNSTRIRATLPTIEYCLQHQAEVVLISHLGRPKGSRDAKLSLQPVATELAKLLATEVKFVTDWRTEFTGDAVSHPGKLSVIENIRFEAGEEKNDSVLGRQLAEIGDVYILDAFGTIHRKHASTHSAVEQSQLVGAGLLLAQEISALDNALSDPVHPFVAVIGGAKVSSKLEVLRYLATLTDSLLVGGGMANTLLLAKGVQIGKSIIESDLIEPAAELVTNEQVQLPVDVLVAPRFDSSCNASLRLLDEIQPDDVILDIGPETARRYARCVRQAGTVIWNGPMGVFEWDQFGEGTRVVTEAINETSAFTVAGGGETLAAIARNCELQTIDYVSTGGGAFLEYIQGRQLHGIAALARHM